MNERVILQTRRRKYRDRSIALLILGLCLLLPPFARVALIDLSILSLPLPLIYIFTVWLLLTVGALLLSRPLSEAGEEEAAASSDQGGQN